MEDLINHWPYWSATEWALVSLVAFAAGYFVFSIVADIVFIFRHHRSW